MRVTGPGRFVAALGVIVLVALGLRLAITFGSLEPFNRTVAYDALWYEIEAKEVAHGHGFVFPSLRVDEPTTKAVPSAQHPPLTVLVLAAVAKLTAANQRAMRLTTLLAGVAAVLVIGLLGRELGGERTGLIAAAIAALYPYLWVNDGLIMSESFAVLLVAVALLLTLRLARAPDVALAIGLGVVCGLAALARAELVLLAPLLGLPLLHTWRQRAWSERVRPVAVVLVLAGIVISPWMLYNWSRFEEPTLLSTNDGLLMTGSNCDPVYSGPGIGLWSLAPGACLPKTASGVDESVASRVYRDRAIEYMREHQDRVPLVLAARIGRTWGVYRPADMLSLNEGEGRPRWVTGLGMFFYYPLAALAIGGAVVLRRRRLRWWPVLAPPAIVLLCSLVSYGQTRLRVPAEPSIVVLAAVALAALSARWWPERSNGASSRTEAQAPSSAIDASSSS